MATHITRLTASVGRMGGVNRPDDVKKVQELLNKVPLPEGGPSVPLAVDSLCGPRPLRRSRNSSFVISVGAARTVAWIPMAKPSQNSTSIMSQGNEPTCCLSGASWSQEDISTYASPSIGSLRLRRLADRSRDLPPGGDFERPPHQTPTVFLGGPVTFPCGRPATALRREEPATEPPTFMTRIQNFVLPGAPWHWVFSLKHPGNR